MQLNVEQKKIIQNKPNGQVLIKGVAGSGKTTVAVNKIPFLLKNYCYAPDDKVLLVTFNKSLVKYVEYIYDGILAKEENSQLEFEFDDSKENKLMIKNIYSLIYKYFQKYLKKNNIGNLEIPKDNEAQNALVNAIVTLRKKYPEIKILDTKYLSFLKEEIMWIKSCNYLELEEYQNADRLGRVSKKVDGPQKLRKNSEVRAAIYETMLQYKSNLNNMGKLDYQDMALLALEYVKSNNDIDKYTHIIIDESQDLSRVQLEFIKNLYNEKDYSSIMFVADIAQSIYPQAWLVKSRSFSSIGFDMTGKSSSLSKNYRTTTEIALAAYSLIEKNEEIINDDNFVKPALIDRRGKYPVFISFSDRKAEIKYIVDLINDNLLKNYSYSDIAIIAKKKEQLKEIKSNLLKYAVPCELFNENLDFKSNTIKLVTMHSVKGLEFKAVIISDISEGKMPQANKGNDYEDKAESELRERKLLYVGMTRATEELFLTSIGKPSQFIVDINYKYLTINNKNKFRRIHRIEPEDYLFKDKITDVYSEEEKVRQWLIKELLEVYKYPRDLIELEYRVNNGSRIMFADGVVNKYVNQSKQPFIVFETKKWGAGVKGALAQLKSYLCNIPTAEFGIATDGNLITIVDKEGNELNDIPEFTTEMMQVSLNTYRFHDLKHSKKINFVIDRDEPKKIYVDNNGTENVEEDVIPIPIFNSIAAGTPILLNEMREGYFYLPKAWFNNLQDIFMIKVKGDSMIGKDINDGDYVIINKQQYAEIGDITAVEIDGNTTLKTYKIIGHKILLEPENKLYEPQIYDEEQVNILGVTIGVIKC